MHSTIFGFARSDTQTYNELDEETLFKQAEREAGADYIQKIVVDTEDEFFKDNIKWLKQSTDTSRVLVWVDDNTFYIDNEKAKEFLLEQKRKLVERVNDITDEDFLNAWKYYDFGYDIENYIEGKHGGFLFVNQNDDYPSIDHLHYILRNSIAEKEKILYKIISTTDYHF